MTEHLLTLRQVAERLHLCRHAVCTMMTDGRFGPDVLRLGRVIRVRESELSAWLAAGAPSRALWVQIQHQGVS
jgi:predicted DNA-binding transcriptional regulator AlpA